MSPLKPLGIKSYGHIPHLPNSRLGVGDHKCDAGQARIATVKVRDRHDRIIVQEKLDGSNVGVARIDGMLYPLGRSGYGAATSPYRQHQLFADWVYERQDLFMALLQDGERFCGEWLAQAHGTRYALTHEPFVIFDLMRGWERATWDTVVARLDGSELPVASVIHTGGALSVEAALRSLRVSRHGAIDPVEGAVWRVERHDLIAPGKSSERQWKVDYLVKYVRSDKQDGCYLPEITGAEAVWNWLPAGMKGARHPSANAGLHLP
jgi:RNA ligase